ncbi:MAG TPA: hypothetical protein VFN87_16145 [Solirubrobacteraceae bacterium]|nr:hypothetical protein [Solirubrobacteraceae bacterium]
MTGRMKALTLLACASALLSGGAMGASSALAASAGANPILQECPSGRLSQAYTVAQLRHALAIMPADTKQYTSCVDVIQTAIINATHRRSGGTSGGSGGGSFLPTPVIVILALLVVAALGFAGLALARRGGRPSGSPPDDPAG